jgi:hypothetical protein
MCACATAAAANRPLRTAVYFDPQQSGWNTSASALAAARIRAAGATAARITVYWRQVAPATRPDKWDPADPADANYDWGQLDARVRAVVRRGLQPLITVLAAPRWAQGAKPVASPNSYLPDPGDFGKFATAIAKRYSGRFKGLPRVRWWQAWNEPNISLYLVPQLEDGKPVSPDWYRKMLNAFAAGIHGVHADNLVVSAGLAPFRDITDPVMQQDKDWGPMSFMRDLLCLSKTLKPTCNDKTSFDVWATHPYTSGNPLHHAVLPNDVSLGDLPKMRRVLNAAIRAHHIASRHAVQFWVTEFSWDSSPPDPCSPPFSLLSRWIPEGLYRMWANGVSLVVWLQLEDYVGVYQGGFYFYAKDFAKAKAKPTLEGFRFPFVALRRGKGVYIWARTPTNKPARLIVEQQSRAGRPWHRVAVLNAAKYGIAQKVLRSSRVGRYRARMFPTDEASLPFSMKVPSDHFYNPFGSPQPFEPGDHPRCTGG